MAASGSREDTIFPLTLQRTYFDMGFFNVKVNYDHFVRQSEGTIQISLEGEMTPISAQVNRTANPNGTARIMGGVPLRDWFQRRCHVMDTLLIDMGNPRVIYVSRR